MKLTFTLIALYFSIELMAQKAGTLDSSFGVDGILIGQSSSTAQVHVAGTVKNKFVAGYSVSTSPGFVLSQYTNTGTVDSAFGINGTVVTTFPSGNSYCSALKTQSEGKTIAAGTINVNGYSHLGIARYNTDGKPDNSFGQEGLVDFAVDKRISTYLLDMAVQQDGKILITAYTNQKGDYENVVFRFNQNGSLDTSFGNNGEVFSALTYVTGYSPVIVQPDGKFLVAGNSPGNSAEIARYDNSGTLDSSFGKNGIAVERVGDYNTFCAIISLAIQKNGFIICGGEEVKSNETPGIILVRFTNNGLADSTFGEGGIVSTVLSNESTANKILIQKDQRIVVAASLISLTDTNKLVVVRYMADGNIDSSFGVNGKNLTAIQDQVSCTDALLQSNEEILLAGISVKYSVQNVSNVSFAKYHNDVITKKQIIVQKIRHYIQTHNAQATTLNNISIYPNPAQSILHIKGLSSNAKLTIVDFSGNVIVSRELSIVSGVYDLNISSLHTGNYLLKIETNGEVVTKQFVKE